MMPQCCYCPLANHVGHIWVPCEDCQRERKISIRVAINTIRYAVHSGFTSREEAQKHIEVSMFWDKLGYAA